MNIYSYLYLGKVKFRKFKAKMIYIIIKINNNNIFCK